jgi:glutathione S-transferase
MRRLSREWYLAEDPIRVGGTMLDDDRRGGDEERLVLYTFALSHFSEKIRWTLALAEVPFDEVTWTPFFHVLKARKRGRATTVPVLQTTGGPVQDSTRILHWLEKHRAPFALLPEASAERDDVLAVEAKFDRVGSQVVRYVYSEALGQTENVVRYWTVEATPTSRT